MTFLQLISAYSLGLKEEKDLPDLALAGLEEGHDSQSLQILAGKNRDSNPFELKEYFLKMLNELGLKFKEEKQALISVVVFYAKNIVDNKTDTYRGFEKLNDIVTKTKFHCEDIGLMPCYADYISIWETKMDGIDFHTAEELTKEKYIEKTEAGIREYLKDWLIVNECDIF